MPYVDGSLGAKPPEGIRSYAEAWDLALDNQKMLYSLLYKFVAKHSLPYYKGEALATELESYAWEAFFNACLKWDETKGYQLSTYAYPSVTNAMKARMKSLSRMGSSMTGYQEKGIKHERPKLSSLSSLDDIRAEARAEEVGNRLSDLLPSAMNQEPEPLLEDTVVDAIAKAELIKKIHNIINNMSEPHATAIRLCYLAKPTNAYRPQPDEERSVGPGLTLREISEQMGYATITVRQFITEGLEYIRHQLKAQGVEED